MPFYQNIPQRKQALTYLHDLSAHFVLCRRSRQPTRGFPWGSHKPASIAPWRIPRTAARLKDAVSRGIEKTLDEGLEIERAHIVEMLKSDDYKEGLTAFAERRQPVFD